MTQTKPQMTEQHRAMPWQWETIERKHYHAEFSTILELRARVEALESAVKPNHPAKPDISLVERSLVERVAAAITGEVDDPIKWKPEARAAIREVEAWLREQKSYPHALAAVILEEEAKR